MIIKFKGCDKLKYEGFNVPRQAISTKNGTAVCFARLDSDGQLQLVQFCIRGRMNNPLSGIEIKCCPFYQEIEHCIDVPDSELDSNPKTF
jgi:hypothetical protein